MYRWTVLKIAIEIGAHHGLTLAKDSRGREVLTRDGKVFLNQLKAEFYDLDLRLSIMDQRGVDRQVLSPAGTEQRNQGCQCL